MNFVRDAKSEITRQDIRTLIELFYARIRKEPRLGPIFEHHVGTDDAAWVRHLGKIESFWANVMLQDRVYDGNPMQVHLGIPEIEQSDFTRWLDLFETTANEVLAPKKAEVFDILARRIGRSLSMGIDHARTAGPPQL